MASFVGLAGSKAYLELSSTEVIFFNVLRHEMPRNNREVRPNDPEVTGLLCTGEVIGRALFLIGMSSNQ